MIVGLTDRFRKIDVALYCIQRLLYRHFDNTRILTYDVDTVEFDLNVAKKQFYYHLFDQQVACELCSVN